MSRGHGAYAPLPSLRFAAWFKFPAGLDQIVMRRNDVPGCAGVEADIGAGNEIQSIHQPNRRRAVAVLPLDVGLAVAVEVGRGMDLPGGADIRSDVGAG